LPTSVKRVPVNWHLVSLIDPLPVIILVSIGTDTIVQPDPFSAPSDDGGQMMLVLPIDDVDIYKKRDRLIVKVGCDKEFYIEQSIFPFISIALQQFSSQGSKR
jgi:hypothetical protein